MFNVKEQRKSITCNIKIFSYNEATLEGQYQLNQTSLKIREIIPILHLLLRFI